MCRRRVIAVALLLVTLTARPALADSKPAKGSDNYDEIVATYLRDARAQVAIPSQQGWGWMGSLSLDRRARNVNDLLTIRVVENITGSGTADSALSKGSEAAASVTSLFGSEKKYSSWMDPTSLVGAKAKTDFKGNGATTRAGGVTAIMTARVAEVLPNGDLVVEGIREIQVNGDRQIVVLTGVARVADIGANNVVPSTAIGQLRIRYFGRGLMKDNLEPGWLIRILNKVF